jgi:predicted nucleic acid-binding protein
MNLVLADTSVWISHFRKPNPVLQTLLSADQVLAADFRRRTVDLG